MEKRAWVSLESLLCIRMWVTAGLEHEETAPSRVAAVDLEATLRRKTREVCGLNRREQTND